MADLDKETKSPSPVDTYELVDDTLEDVLYARHAEIETFEDLEKQRGTSIPALFNQLYKFVQNPSSISVETYKRMVDTDDTVGSGVDFLTTCLSARLGRYVHPNKDITDFVNKRLDEIDGGFTNLLKELLSACWAGFSVAEIVWSNTENGFVPKRVVTLPPNTILFETERTGELTPDGIMQYQRNYNPYLGNSGLGYLTGSALGFTGFDAGRPDPFAKFGDFPFPIRTANSFNYLSIRIPVQKCIHYPFNAQGQFGNPYGRSLLRRIYKYYVMKDAILQMKMIALDRKGTALTVVFCDPNAMMEDPDQDNGTGPQQYRNQKGKGKRADQAARDAFKNIHNDSVILLPGKQGENYDVEFMPQASNVQDFIAAEDFCNKSMLRGLLLPSLIFGNGDGTGSYSLGQEHAKTFDKICDSVNAGLEHVILQQLIKPMIAYNYPYAQWKDEGLGSFGKKTLSRDEIEKEAALYSAAITDGIIDTQDLNDLNKMRDTLGFEPRDKVIPKPEIIPGMGGLNGDDGQPADDSAGVGGVEPAVDKEKKESEEEDPKEEKKLSLYRKIVNAFAMALGLSKRRST